MSQSSSVLYSKSFAAFIYRGDSLFLWSKLSNTMLPTVNLTTSATVGVLVEEGYKLELHFTMLGLEGFCNRCNIAFFVQIYLLLSGDISAISP